MLVDGDGHVMEPMGLWAERMDSERWGDLVPHFSDEDQAFYVGGEVRSGGASAVADVARINGISEEELLAAYGTTISALSREGGHDPHARISDMDSDGFTAAVLYPSTALFFGPVDHIAAVRDPQFVAACQRAYNEWISEYCAAYPDRLFGMAAVPLQ